MEGTETQGTGLVSLVQGEAKTPITGHGRNGNARNRGQGMGSRVELGKRTLTAFQNGRGWSYLDVNEIVGISAPVKGKGGFAESRRVMIRGGGIDYILNTPENFAQLEPVLGGANPASWKPQDALSGAGTVRAGSKRGRGRKVARVAAGGAA
jgi:hypothetical protein